MIKLNEYHRNLNTFEAEEKHAVNACRLCNPLGACMVYKGLERCLPLIHGSQGCATYIRRYLISHYREPMDIASSNFVESTTVFGGLENFNTSLDNIISQYHPEIIGICTTCLSETIGDDINMFLNEYRKSRKGRVLPEFVTVSTPSYRGSHIDGFHAAVKAVVTAFAGTRDREGDFVNIFPGFISPADIRYLKEILDDFELKYVMIPDYSLSLDNPIWNDYQRIPEGGTPLAALKQVASAKASIEFGTVFGTGMNPATTAARYLEETHGIKRYQLGLPIGIKGTDQFFNVLEELAGTHTPSRYRYERGRLIDSFVDGHKYLFGKKAVVYGDEDMVISLYAFLEEIGIQTVLCGSGGNSGKLTEQIHSIHSNSNNQCHPLPTVLGGADFSDIEQQCKVLEPDVFIGNSKGYTISREMDKPLVRCGFPIHDRIGAQRLLHLGYRGTQALFDTITNALISQYQETSPVGYKYI